MVKPYIQVWTTTSRCSSLWTRNDPWASSHTSRPSVHSAFGTSRFSALLPSAFTISETKLRQSQLPPVVTDSVTGAKYLRPAYWQ